MQDNNSGESTHMLAAESMHASEQANKKSIQLLWSPHLAQRSPILQKLLRKHTEACPTCHWLSEDKISSTAGCCLEASWLSSSS